MTQERALETATAEELWDELSSRFRGCIFIWERAMQGNTNSDVSEIGGWWSASIAERLGLLQYATGKFTRQMQRMVEKNEE